MIPRGRSGPVDPARHSVPPDGRPAEEQPRWRRDFPVDVAEDEYVARREFVKFLVLTSGAFAVGQLWLVVKSLLGGEERAAAAPAAIAGRDELPVGGAKTFTWPEGSTPRILVRTGADTYVAYDQQCTHLLCPVVPAVEQGRLHCPCHNGWFDLTSGRPVAGPPRRPLTRIRLEVRPDAVYAVGVEERSS